jgi:hypothetical protein
VKRLVAYGCGSPIRQPIIQAMSRGSRADMYLPQAEPEYQGGDSIIWGLIRGAPRLMEHTRSAGFDFFQLDNAYFGRNRYFRVTKNSTQLTRIVDREPSRFQAIFRELGLSMERWKKQRNGPIVVCLSSPFLFGFYGLNIWEWSESVISQIRQVTDRPIQLRPKDAVTPIDQEIIDAWCVITHVSAAALDALRLGIPVVTTQVCAATPLATPMREIDNPRMLDGRENLFSTLAYGQFTQEEMNTGLAWKIVSEA